MRNRRIGSERSKFGCQTCKIRRVKCDQTLPQCSRCLSTGRHCDGPATKQIRFLEDRQSVSAHALLQQTTLLSTRHNDDERWAFNYFIHRAAPIFAGVVDGPFWLDLVPRLAQTHDFVWDAVISASWMMEHVQYNDLKLCHDSTFASDVVEAEHRKALIWYQRSLARFREMLDQGKADDGYILLTCILYAGLEFQQKHIGNAWRLVDSAVALLGRSISVFPSRVPALEDFNLYESAMSFFSRKAVVTGPLGKPIPLTWNDHIDEGQLSPSIQHTLALLKRAKSQFDILMYEAYEVVRVGNLLYSDSYEMRKLKPKQESHLKVIQQ